MAKQTINVPDIGGAKEVAVIEVHVAVGDMLDKEESIITLESDKASMDIPSPMSGKVTNLKIKVGDLVSEGDALIELETVDTDTESESTEAKAASAEKAETSKVPEQAENPEVSENSESQSIKQKKETGQKKSHNGSKQIINVPDIGGAKGVAVIEVHVAVGDDLEKEQSIATLESDKASMDIPAPMSGKITDLKIKVGDSVSEGDPLIELETTDTESVSPETEAKRVEEPTKSDTKEASAESAEISKPKATKISEKTVSATADQSTSSVVNSSSDVYAGPSVRKFAREISVDLSQVTGTGLRSRITKSNVKDYVKGVMTGRSGVPGGFSNASVTAMPVVDFASFGEVDSQEMSKIKKLTAANMTRNWLNIPHVTQFDDADVTDLETFRESLKVEAEEKNIRLTLMPFLLKACASALFKEPAFNASINSDGTHIIYKKYAHIGIAVDTPTGLMVPVLRDVDKKGLWQLAKEFIEITQKARDGKLSLADMQGGCFTISSLGAIGGNGFTPIVNAPEVAILGVSKASMKPVWNGSEFVPRQMLPLSLSYDHRAVNGADAGRFFTYLISVIADVRHLLL